MGILRVVINYHDVSGGQTDILNWHQFAYRKYGKIVYVEK